MSEPAETPWRNGYYYNYEKDTSAILLVDGLSLEFKPLICLDFPDIESHGKGTWVFGDLGKACKEIQEVSGGIINYNIRV